MKREALTFIIIIMISVPLIILYTIDTNQEYEIEWYYADKSRHEYDHWPGLPIFTRSPIAYFTIEPSGPVYSGNQILLNGSGSTGFEKRGVYCHDSFIDFEWHIENNTYTGMIINYTFSDPGTYKISLKVSYYDEEPMHGEYWYAGEVPPNGTFWYDPFHNQRVFHRIINVIDFQLGF